MKPGSDSNDYMAVVAKQEGLLAELGVSESDNYVVYGNPEQEETVTLTLSTGEVRIDPPPGGWTEGRIVSATMRLGTILRRNATPKKHKGPPLILTAPPSPLSTPTP